jgi:hypothetical protein
MFKIAQLNCGPVLTVLSSSIINRTVNPQRTTPIQNGTLCFWSCNYPVSMKRSELTNKQKLLVPCPICGAAIGVHCQMYSGFGRRNEAHSERKYYAIQAIEHGYGRDELLRTFIRVESAHIWQTVWQSGNS